MQKHITEISIQGGYALSTKLYTFSFFFIHVFEGLNAHQNSCYRSVKLMCGVFDKGIKCMNFLLDRF